MKTLQEKVMNIIEAAAEDRGLEMILSANYANCGVARLQKAASFANVAEITYHFDTTHMKLTLKILGKHYVAARQAGRTDGYVDWYMDNGATAEIEEFFATLRKHLPDCSKLSAAA